jgi:hypothetical protein
MVAERVAAGVAWLDENVPGWAERIDLEQLNLASCQRCVLGQLFGDFNDAPQPASGLVTSAHLGFDRHHGEPNFTAYSALTAEWRRVIEQRQAGAK